MASEQLKNQLVLLKIRLKAYRRDSIIAGGVFLLSFAATVVSGITENLNDKALYLLSALIICFGMSYIMAWVRLQVIRGSIETVELLQRVNSEGGREFSKPGF